MLSVGVLLVVISGPGSVQADVVLLEEVPSLLLQPACLAFFAVVLAAVIGWMLLTKTNACAAYKPPNSSITTTVCSACTSAMIGSLSVVSLKLVVMGISGWAATGVFPPPLSVVCLLFLVIFGWLQLYLLNVALSSGQAMFAIPLYLSLICVFISFAAGVVFNEFVALMRDPVPLFLLLYIAGLLLVLGALCGLAYSQKIKAQREERSMKTAGTLRSADGSSKLVVESTGANNGVAAASAVPAKTQVDLAC